MSVSISCEIKKILFYNKENSYCKLEAEIKKQHNCNVPLKNIEIRGYFLSVYQGDEFLIEGELLSDKKGFRYLKPFSIRNEFSVNIKAIYSFFSRRQTRIHKRYIDKIIINAGEDFFYKLYKDQTYIDKFKIPEIERNKIMKIVNENMGYSDLISFLLLHDFSPKIAKQIWDKNEIDSVNILKENPYSLFWIKDIKFFKIEQLAKSLGIKYNNTFRVQKGILSYIDDVVLHSGDIYIEKEELFKNVPIYLKSMKVYNEDLSKEELKLALTLICKNTQSLIIIPKEIEGKTYNYVYKKALLKFEDEIVNEIARRLKLNAPYEEYQVLYALSSYKIPLDKGQKQAVINTLINNFSILTGGPGTGKTSTTKAIIHCLKVLSPEGIITPMAPTGRASRRIQEMTLTESKTIHKSIGLHYSKTPTIIVDTDFVIIDETSMVDIVLFHSLLCSIPKDAQILLIGDKDQLSPIGAGFIFKDLIETNLMPTSRLTTIFRQSQGSKIIDNSHKIINNEIKISDLKNSEDFFFINTKSSIETFSYLIKSFNKMIKKYSLKDVMILTPMKQGNLGTSEINYYIQNKINPRNGNDYILCNLTNIEFRKKDRVIHKTNNYDLNIMNGEIGTIVSIYDDIVEVEYPDEDGYKIIPYDYEVLTQLDLAYAITIHKSQGSEFPIVITPLDLSHGKMLNRNLVYTAWTRAKKILVSIGDPNIINELSFMAKTKNSDIKDKLILKINKSA